MKNLIALLLLYTAALNAQVWKQEGIMPLPVSNAAAVANDSLIYIIGGFSDSLNTNVNVIQEYNPQTKAWRTAAHLNENRAGLIACGYSDSIFIAGGRFVNSSEMWDKHNPPYIYNSQTHFNRINAQGEIIGDNLFIFGGSTNAVLAPFIVEFNLPSRDVTYTNSLLFTSLFPQEQMSVASGDTIYIMGGVLFGVLKNIYCFDASSKEFTQLNNSLITQRAGGDAVLSGGRIYVIGGFNELNDAMGSVEVINIRDNNSVTAGPELLKARKEPVAVVYKNSIYVFGGLDADHNDVSLIERLDLVTGITDEDVSDFSYGLFNNYPNPFNPSTVISFSLGKTSRYSLDIYSITGQHVCTLSSGSAAAGIYKYTWDSKNSSGLRQPSGVYICRLTTPEFSSSKKMLLIK